MAGGGEDGEKPLDAAVREIWEETGVAAATVVPLTSMAYIPANIISEKHRRYWSEDTFVIPEYAFAFECGSDVRLSDEHVGFKWLGYDEAMPLLTWDSSRTALYELNCRLRAERQRLLP